jgi:ubiquinone/menaquinone biosynthesis C-methylase UbiE
MSQDPWRPSLRAFFNTRATQVSKIPTFRELCFIAGREPRLWGDKEVFEDLVDDIARACEIGKMSTVLEVGCAAGFIARGIAPRVRKYHGVDLAAQTIKVARRLKLPNARFSVADGNALQFRANSFDAAFCYNVFINFPDFVFGTGLIREMIRVVRPGGRVLVGQIPDRANQVPFEAKAAKVVRGLDERYGPLGPDPQRPSAGRLTQVWRRMMQRQTEDDAQPRVTCYYFDRRDFVDLAAEIGAAVAISSEHARSPYADFRFNAVYQKPE